MNSETTGKLAVQATNMGTTVRLVQDCGWYEGTRRELNVRKVKEIETFPGLTVASKSYPKGDCYGSSWGDGTGLILVTEAQIEALRAESATVLAARAERRAKEEKRSAAVNRSTGWFVETEDGPELAGWA